MVHEATAHASATDWGRAGSTLKLAVVLFGGTGSKAHSCTLCRTTAASRVLRISRSECQGGTRRLQLLPYGVAPGDTTRTREGPPLAAVHCCLIRSHTAAWSPPTNEGLRVRSSSTAQPPIVIAVPRGSNALT